MANFDDTLKKTGAWYTGVMKRIENSAIYQKWLSVTEDKRLKRRIQVQQHDIMDCGAACLASIAAHYNLDVPIAMIRQYASTDKKGTNLLGVD
jgi:hypothetical protein